MLRAAHVGPTAEDPDKFEHYPRKRLILAPNRCDLAAGS